MLENLVEMGSQIVLTVNQGTIAQLEHQTVQYVLLEMIVQTLLPPHHVLLVPIVIKVILVVLIVQQVITAQLEHQLVQYVLLEMIVLTLLLPPHNVLLVPIVTKVILDVLSVQQVISAVLLDLDRVPSVWQGKIVVLH